MYVLSSTEPQWLDLVPGVRGLFAPVSPTSYRRAKRAARTVLMEKGSDALEEAADAFSAVLIRTGLVGWEGVGDADGKVIEVSPEAVELFLADAKLFEAADTAYVGPFTAVDAEKNVSSGSGNGTSEAPTPEKPTAPPAPKRARTARTKSTPRAR